jgi:hypothetical protein
MLGTVALNQFISFDFFCCLTILIICITAQTAQEKNGPAVYRPIFYAGKMHLDMVSGVDCCSFGLRNYLSDLLHSEIMVKIPTQRILARSSAD